MLVTFNSIRLRLQERQELDNHWPLPDRVWSNSAPSRLLNVKGRAVRVISSQTSSVSGWSPSTSLVNLTPKRLSPWTRIRAMIWRRVFLVVVFAYDGLPLATIHQVVLIAVAVAHFQSRAAFSGEWQEVSGNGYQGRIKMNKSKFSLEAQTSRALEL